MPLSEPDRPLAAPEKLHRGPLDFQLAYRLETPVWVYDIDNRRVLYANAAACVLWQAENEAELQARDLSHDMSTTVANRLRQYQVDFLDRDATFSELWTLYPNGVATNVNVAFRGFVTEDNRMAMQCEVIGGLEAESPDNLRSAEAVLHTDVMIGLFSQDGPPLYLNPAARQAIVGAERPLRDLFLDAEDYATLLFELDRSSDHRAVTRLQTTNGDLWFDVSARNCLDAATGQPAILLTAIDVSALKDARDKARHLAERDLLTGCYNRLYLQEHFADLGKITDQTCAAVYFDIDHFKQLNDQFGHEMGDVVLKEISARARGCVAEGDILARLGGDEFVLLLNNVRLENDDAPVLDQLQSVLSKPVFHDGRLVTVSVSMGAASFDPLNSCYADVLRNADVALYQSKAEGRNRWRLFDESLGHAAEERRLVEMEIKNAIENREFVLHYQPRIDLASGRVLAAEALVRWNHPVRGLIAPGNFIPTCEETGMILELGHQILEMGCDQAFAWQRAGHDIGVSINISPRQFDDPRLMDCLDDYAGRPGFPWGRIELEITEGVLIGDLSQIQTKLEAIRTMGYRIAIDDFGTGYSSLTYISRFPLNSLKIDRSFIQQLPTSGPIISLILTLAGQIGARTVAEGVESEDELAWLVANACDEAQGYYHHPPLPRIEFEALLNLGAG